MLVQEHEQLIPESSSVALAGSSFFVNDKRLQSKVSKLKVTESTEDRTSVCCSCILNYKNPS